MYIAGTPILLPATSISYIVTYLYIFDDSICPPLIDAVCLCVSLPYTQAQEGREVGYM